jgi:hypothetical protein
MWYRYRLFFCIGIKKTHHREYRGPEEGKNRPDIPPISGGGTFQIVGLRYLLFSCFLCVLFGSAVLVAAMSRCALCGLVVFVGYSRRCAL